MDVIKTKSDPRARLLETANKLFYAQGYKATGINQIIAEAGVAKASFYHHFKSKEDLLVAWLEGLHNEMATLMRSYVAKGASSADRLRRVFLLIKEFLSGGIMEHG